MAVASEAYKNRYTGDGSTDTYAYGYRIIEAEFLSVHQLVSGESEETELTYGVDYTVTGAGDPDGGNIVLTAGNLDTGDIITIRQNPDLTQTLDLVNQGPFFAQDIEEALDKLCMAMHRFDDAVVRSLKFAETTDLTAVDATLPAPEAGKVFGWNSTGTGLENYNPGSVTLAIPGDLTVTTAKLAAGFTLPIANGGTNSTTAAAARTALGLGTAATAATGTTDGTIPLIGAGDLLATALLPDSSTTAEGIVELATAAEVKTGTDAARVSPVASLTAHAGVAKFWCKFNAAGTVAVSHNVTSITDTGTGDFTVVIATDFGSAEWVASAVCENASTKECLDIGIRQAGQAAGTLRVNVESGQSDGVIDPLSVHVVGFGHQI